MYTTAHTSSKELPSFQQDEGQLSQLRMFLVGTFKDQLVEEGRLKEAVQDISCWFSFVTNSSKSD